MKNMIFFLPIITMLFVFGSCEKDDKSTLDSATSTPAVITSPASDTQFTLVADSKPAIALDTIKIVFNKTVWSVNVPSNDPTLEGSLTSDFAVATKISSAVLSTQGNVFTITKAKLNAVVKAKPYLFAAGVESSLYVRIRTMVNFPATYKDTVQTFSTPVKMLVVPY